jgi:hypothetical protein
MGFGMLTVLMTMIVRHALMIGRGKVNIQAGNGGSGFKTAAVGG